MQCTDRTPGPHQPGPPDFDGSEVVRFTTAKEQELRRLEQQVMQLQRMELVGHMAGGIAHDFRNLLTVILGSAELLLEGAPTGSPERNELQAIMDAAARASTLTSELVGFSVPQASQPADICLDHVVSRMRDLLVRMVGEDVRLSTRLKSAPWCVHADPSQIEQILANLVINARHAMPLGGNVHIDVRDVNLPNVSAGHVPLPPGSYCQLTVSDTGSGMTAETLRDARSFHFTTKDGKGSGIGLATCDRIVRQGRGAIDMQSEPGAGTAVRVYLPRVGAAAETATLPPARCTDDPRGTEAVLIIEDDSAVGGLIERALGGLGYRVRRVASGAEALWIDDEMLESFAAVLCDVIIPDMNGPEIVTRLRGRRTRPLPVLFVSGHANHALLSGGTLQADNSFLQKPLTRTAMARALREVLDA